MLKLRVPPLRERTGDVPLLAEFFLSKFGHMNRRVRRMEVEHLRLLEQYDWPGNVRELEHVIQQLLILGEGDSIDRKSVEDMLRELRSERLSGEEAGGEHGDRGDRLADIEADVIAAVLAEENQNKTKAARRLGINRSTLRRKLLFGAKLTSTDQ